MLHHSGLGALGGYVPRYRSGFCHARFPTIMARGEQHFIGTLVSVLFLVPFANLIAPIVGNEIATGVGKSSL